MQSSQSALRSEMMWDTQNQNGSFLSLECKNGEVAKFLLLQTSTSR